MTASIKYREGRLSAENESGTGLALQKIPTIPGNCAVLSVYSS